jgi:hypothetical protein
MVPSTARAAVTMIAEGVGAFVGVGHQHAPAARLVAATRPCAGVPAPRVAPIPRS